jgi:maltose O-acetyltransferase
MLNWLRELRRRRYLDRLIRSGLRIGPGVYLNDGFFLDPSHCHLITIEEGAVFGPGVTVLAHDASTLKVIGKTRIQAVRIGRGAFVGAGAILLPGSELGDGSILGAGAVLRARVPAGEIWAGNPAKHISTIVAYRTKLLGLDGRDFSEAQYRITMLNDATRREMIDAVTLDRSGFMVPFHDTGK